MSSGRGGAVEIPASTKKVVQSLKEIVANSDEEIYAMLKECNMDLNETVQRLLNQGGTEAARSLMDSSSPFVKNPFHEVKRKRDKKKETGGNKESGDVRGRPGGNYGRGGRGGGGRGSSLTRHSSHEFSSGRGRPFGGRENGIHPSSRGGATNPTSSSQTPPYGQPKPPPPAPSPVPAPVSAQAAPPQPQAPASTSGTSANLSNGSSSFTRPTPGPQGAWGSGHATMADILKARAAPPTPPVQGPVTSLPTPPVLPTVSQSYSTAAPSIPPTESTEFYSSTTDPVLHPSLDSRAVGAQGAIKRDVGTVGHMRPIGDRPMNSLNLDLSSGSPLPTQPSPVVQNILTPPPVESGSSETDLEAQISGPPSPPISASAPSIQDVSVDQAASATDAGTSLGSQSHQPGGRVLGGSQFNGRPMYASQQQPVGTQKAGSGAGLEWKPKASVQNLVGAPPEAAVPSMTTVETSRIAHSLHSLSMQDDQPVIIPNHLRVPEADRTHLSFGSFGAGFGTSFGTSFGIEDVEKSPVELVESIPAEEAPAEQPTPSSVAVPVEMTQSYSHQQVSTPMENMSTSNDAPSVVSPAPVPPPLEQLAKPDPVVQQGPPYPYLPTVSSYPGFGLMPQIPGAQYAYEPADSQPQDVSRLPSLMQPYTDPTTSYYTPAYRPGTDGDARYPPYVPSSAASKYNGNMGLMTGPTLPSSQEAGNPMLSSSVPTAAPTSQSGNNSQTAPTMPQQALPMHYAAQPPLGHFNNFLGYQYMPPNYPYIHTPYQHNYSPSNSGYGQPPTGSTYPPAAASSYPTGGAAPVKYPMPQYKPGTAAGNSPHSAAGVGYGGYTTTPSGYAANPVVTAGNNAGYEDVNASHYKDNTLYIPSQQQGEGSTVWIQTPLPRDMGPTAGMQTSSYYNLAGQGQHSAYAHTQQTAHAHAHPGGAYGNIYHPSQSGPAPSHQMLQQPQGIGGGGAPSAQAGAYQQQPQRAQSWTNY